MNDKLIKSDEKIGELLEKKKLEIQQLLPAGKDVDRFIKSALLAIARDQKLQKCTVKSLFTCVVNAAETDLDFTPAKGHAHIIPYGDVATFMPGYQGFIYLMVTSGVVAKIESRLVYENDKFAVHYGTNPGISHEPYLNGDNGRVIGAYAIAWFPNGTTQFEYMTRDELDSIRNRSKAKNNGPWVTDTGEMQRKTVIRRLRKYISSDSPRLDKAIEYDNNAVGFEAIPVDSNTSRTSDLADLISPQQEPARNVTIEQEQKPTEEPKTKAELLDAIINLNRRIYNLTDAEFLEVCSEITGDPVIDIDKLQLNLIKRIWQVLSNQEIAGKLPFFSKNTAQEEILI